MKFLFIFLAALPIGLFGQRKVFIARTNEAIKIDGEATEASWAKAQATDTFTQFTPLNGQFSPVRTEIKLCYDDIAIYVFVKCYERFEDISDVLTNRDDFNANTDNIQVTIDTYNDKSNGFTFGISSTGTQYDSRMFQNNESIDFNLVWQSKALKKEDGWQAELRIPYSALRFPKKDIQEWGINFYRQRSKFREESCWNPIDPTFDNYVAQTGQLVGLSGIHPPVRLAFIPYLSSYVDRYSPNGTSIDYSQRINGGMDIKYGLNEAFTLDMTLVPDFGQVVFDNKVLNVSPFEIQFNENRQFFTEGTELFTKSGLFYSRRIGVQAPYAVLETQLNKDEYIKETPSTIQLYNASKLSGRTSSGLGIGVFNAISAEQNGIAVSSSNGAERTITLSPLTNYSVLVADQNLPHNGYINLTNTNVTRAGNFYDANTLGISSKVNTKNNTYFLFGSYAQSMKLYSDSISHGGSGILSFGKQLGTFSYNYKMQLESSSYDPNDLGFNTNNNKNIHELTLSYRQFTPTKLFFKHGTSATLSYNRLYVPNVFTFLILDGNSFFITKKFHAFGHEMNTSILEGFDYFEPRSPGRFFIQPKWFEAGIWISTNYQKKIALDVRFKPAITSVRNWNFITYSISPRIRFNDHLLLVYRFDQELAYNNRAFAYSFGIPVIQSSEIVFASRNEINTTNYIEANYSFTYNKSLSFRLRHYRSVLNYLHFYDLQMDGTLVENNMNGLDTNGKSVYNANYNAFTIDCVFRWVITPGTELSLVWKNSIFNSDEFVSYSYLKNTKNMFELIPVNSISGKLIIWMDYLDLKKRTHKRM